LNAARGFTLAELLIAGTLVLLLMTGLAAVVDPGHATSRAQAAATDIRQRLRAASEALSADLRSAGSGPVNGVFGRALGTVAPCVLPFRAGLHGDPAGTVRTDGVSLVTSAGAAGTLADAYVPGVGIALIKTAPGCPVGDESCGLRQGTAVLLVDGRGQSDLFTVATVTGGSLGLEPRGSVSGRMFPPGAQVVPVAVAAYYVRQGSASDGTQLMSGDGGQSDLPLVDHLVGVVIEYFGDPTPPRVLPAGAPNRTVTYGPAPPPAAEDDPRDAWPPGENCTVAIAGTAQVGRLLALPAGAPGGLVPLPASLLADGPWCPDGSAPNRYDADLLRVRAVRVTIRAEAATAAARGADPRLFAHPGSSRDRSGAAADQVVVFDVVPRALHVGR
jgi:hypothetical protein